jgi:hypothetical protein
VSSQPNVPLRLRVHRSALRVRVNLHKFASTARDVLQVARAATKFALARPFTVPTQWRRAVVEDPEVQPARVEESDVTQPVVEEPRSDLAGGTR